MEEDVDLVGVGDEAAFEVLLRGAAALSVVGAGSFCD